jgi:hypothetical protein
VNKIREILKGDLKRRKKEFQGHKISCMLLRHENGRMSGQKDRIECIWSRQAQNKYFWNEGNCSE